MRTLTRRLAPHARASWITLTAVSVLAVVFATAAVVLDGGGRPTVVGTVCTGVLVFAVLAAFLDAILVPGNPDVRRPAGQAVGWTGAVGSDGGSGDGAGSW